MLYGSNQGRCVICSAVGVSDAYYCQGCVIQEKDRDGCPKIINLGSAKTDLFYHKKAAGEIAGRGGRINTNSAARKEKERVSSSLCILSSSLFLHAEQRRSLSRC